MGIDYSFLTISIAVSDFLNPIFSQNPSLSLPDLNTQVIFPGSSTPINLLTNSRPIPCFCLSAATATVEYTRSMLHQIRLSRSQRHALPQMQSQFGWLHASSARISFGLARVLTILHLSAIGVLCRNHQVLMAYRLFPYRLRFYSARICWWRSDGSTCWTVCQ